MRLNQPVTQDRVSLGPNANILSTTDPKGRITYVNQEFLDVSGFSNEELLGQPHNVIRHPDMPRTAFESFWRALKSGKSWMGIVKNRCKSGDHYWVHAYVTPILDDEGNLRELQSVRQEPDEAAVARATKLYHHLSSREPDKGAIEPPPRPRLTFGVQTRLALLFGAVLVPLIVAAAISTPLAQLVGFAVAVCIFLAGLSLALHPVSAAIAAATDLVDDPLAEKIYFGKHDEESRIGLALLQLKTELQAVSKRLSDTIRVIDAEAGTTSSAIDQGHSIAFDQMSRTQQAATAMEEMSQAVQQVTSNVSDGATRAREITEQTESGMETVEQSSHAVRELAARVQDASAVIKELVQETQGIETALTLIQGITAQTNLLALNAAIEAARAGEAGRGFSVVADEVRALALRTSQSTTEIQGIVESIRQQSTKAVTAMDESYEVATGTLTCADESHDALRNIHAGVASIRDFTHQIASATEEQSVAAEEVNQTISTIDQLAGDVQRNTKLAKERMVVLGEEIQRTAGLTKRFAGC